MKRFVFAIAFVLLIALPLSSCSRTPAISVQDTPAAADTAQPAAVDTPQPAATAAAAEATVTPPPPTIEYASVDSAAVKKFMQVEVGGPLDAALAILGEPEKIYGQDGYRYRAVAGSENEQAALVYRFEVDGTPLELIVGMDDKLVLKKQISTPAVMPALLHTTNTAQIPDGMPYREALAQLGKNPYLWMEFTLPNPAPEDANYQVAVWPDDDGQFVAVIKDATVLRSEYQPKDVVLDAAGTDGITPRVPRYLEPLPKNANSKVTGNSYFKKFASLKINAPEQAITAAFGQPASVDESAVSVRVLHYEFISADFALARFIFTFTLTSEGESLLTAKNASLLPAGETDIRLRYAPQMISGMQKADVEKIMGKGFWADLEVEPIGRKVASYMWAGEKACVCALFKQGEQMVLGNAGTANDTPEEAASLYEEYVIVLPKGKTPSKPRTTPRTATTPPVTTSSPAPTDTPSMTRPPVTPPPPTPTPTWRPGRTFIIPSIPPIRSTPTIPIIK